MNGSASPDMLMRALRAYETAVRQALRRAPNHWHEYRDPFELGTEITDARRLTRSLLEEWEQHCIACGRPGYWKKVEDGGTCDCGWSEMCAEKAGKPL